MDILDKPMMFDIKYAMGDERVLRSPYITYA